MKSQAIIILSAVIGLFSAQTGFGDILYNHGPVSGEISAASISPPFTTSNQFPITTPSTVGGFDFGAWTSHGDSITSLDWSITSDHNGGTVFSSETGATPIDTFLFTNSMGDDIYSDFVSTGNLVLQPGTYWLNLDNAMTAQGGFGDWDEADDGNNQGFQTGPLGDIASESFDILGPQTTSTPEPSTVAAFFVGFGVLGGLVALRRKQLKN